MRCLHFLCLIACVVFAAPPNPDIDVMSETDLDPTVLRTRVKLSNEYVDRDFGGSENTTTLNFSYAFGNPARRDWSAQLDLPLVNYNAGDQANSTDATGLGDIELRILHVFDAGGVFRWGLGAQAHFNTASEPQLGDSAFRLSPALNFALQPCRSFKFQTIVQFDQSLVTDSGVPEQQALEARPAVQFDLPFSCYGYVETELSWNLKADAKLSSTLKIELGRGFGSRKEWVASMLYQTPLTESADHYSLTAGLSYVFP